MSGAAGVMTVEAVKKISASGKELKAAEAQAGIAASATGEQPRPHKFDHGRRSTYRFLGA